MKQASFLWWERFLILPDVIHAILKFVWLSLFFSSRSYSKRRSVKSHFSEYWPVCGLISIKNHSRNAKINYFSNQSSMGEPGTEAFQMAVVANKGAIIAQTSEYQRSHQFSWKNALITKNSLVLRFKWDILKHHMIISVQAIRVFYLPVIIERRCISFKLWYFLVVT